MKVWIRHLEQNRCVLLLITLFALLLVHPALNPGRFGSIILGILGSGIIFFALYAVASKRRHFAAAVILGIATLVTTWGASLLQTKGWFLFSDYTDALFYLYMSVFLMRYAMSSGPVTNDKLYGAAAVYIILALMWGRLYHAIHVVNPDAFTGSGAPGPVVDITNTDVFTYFSFITLTTLGYGDISPASSFARTLTSLEAAVGALFLAVVIARLVGLYRDHPEKGI